MNEQELRNYLETLTREQIIEIAIGLAESEKRLRKELDEVKGIIR